MDYYELDFFEIGDGCSGDALALRYGQNGTEYVHVVDGGFADDGQRVLGHINDYYDQKNFIDNVVLTHPDMDHASGLKSVIANTNVGTLWMNRPWAHVDELLPMFDYQYTREGLIRRLKENYPHVAELEEIANRNNIEIEDAFQGTRIGAFTVLAPTRDRYLGHILNSDKTPEATVTTIVEGAIATVVSAVRSVASLWGHENLKGDTEGTSDENETSIIQYANLAGHHIFLTGDAGIKGLEEAHNYVSRLGIFPGVTYFQIPHHGSRRNLSSEMMDKWFGPVLPNPSDTFTFTAIASASGSDTDHPRKTVVRAFYHRGGRVATTENAGIRCFYLNTPARDGWVAGGFSPYPEESEE